MFSTLCLLGMLGSYAVPIYAVASAYTNNLTISSLLKDNTLILQSMFVMGFFTLLYEWSRDHIASLLTIACLLASIYGLLWFDESQWIHYLFATSAISAINAFLWIHATSWIGMGMACVETALSLDIAYELCYDGSIFIQEALVLALFAFQYLGLHFTGELPSKQVQYVADNASQTPGSTPENSVAA
jgi:hypothetical protein